MRPCSALSRSIAIGTIVLAFGLVAAAQTPPGSTAAPPTHSTKPVPAPEVHAIKEDDLKPQFVGKTLYLRGEYVDDRLHFNEQGQLIGSSPKASYTLAMVQINKIDLGKHKLELQGIRYGLHFIGAEPTEDQPNRRFFFFFFLGGLAQLRIAA